MASIRVRHQIFSGMAVGVPNNDHCHPVPRVMTWQPVLLMEWHLPPLPAVDVLLPAGGEPRVTADGLIGNRIATGP